MNNPPDSTVTTHEPSGRFEHVVVERPDGIDVCAFVPPADAPASETTAWIRATGTSFVDRASMR